MKYEVDVSREQRKIVDLILKRYHPILGTSLFVGGKANWFKLRDFQRSFTYCYTVGSQLITVNYHPYWLIFHEVRTSYEIRCFTSYEVNSVIRP